MKVKIITLFILFSIKSMGQKQFEVFFDFNKDFPNEKSITEINEWIAKNKDTKVTKLQGFCDSIDTKKYNKILSERRIENIQILLVKSGLKFSKDLQKVAFGKDFKQSKIQAENRKVIIYYSEPEIVAVESELTKLIRDSKVGEKIKLPNIYFYGGSDKVLQKSEPTLKDLLQILNDNPTLKIEIQGHICCFGPNDFDSVSAARAKAIYDFLIKNKINNNRLAHKGYGIKTPIYKIPERNEEERIANRRVEILIVEK
jgi:outer membrane protein OmpA-like peptidoglycan-associated protein